ncbi:hypothetical protein Sgri01_06322 [Streptomyces griseus]
MLAVRSGPVVVERGDVLLAVAVEVPGRHLRVLRQSADLGDPVDDIVGAGLHGTTPGLVGTEAAGLPRGAVHGGEQELAALLAQGGAAGVALADRAAVTGDGHRRRTGRAHGECPGVQPIGHPGCRGAAVAQGLQALPGHRGGVREENRGDVGDRLGQLGHDQVTIGARDQLGHLDDLAGCAGQVRSADGRGGLQRGCAGGYRERGLPGGREAAARGQDPLGVDQGTGAGTLRFTLTDVELRGEGVGAVRDRVTDDGLGGGGERQGGRRRRGGSEGNYALPAAGRLDVHIFPWQMGERG